MSDGDAEPNATRKHDRRRFRLKVFYGIGSIAFGVKDNGFSVLLLLFYNQAMGLDARLAGLAIMIALVIDAIIDPVIGYASDNLSSRWGRRHPFMYASAIPVSLSYLLLFSPPLGLSQGQLFAYLLVVAVVVRIFIAVYEIPSAALIAELTDDYDERTSYLSYRFFFGWIGGLTMSILAFAVFLQRTPDFPVGQLNVGGYANYGMVAAALIFFAILLSSIGTHSAIRDVKARPPRTAGSIGDVFREIGKTLSNRSAMTMLLAGMCAALSSGLTFALVFYFQTYFWQLTPGQISVLVSSNFVSAGVALLLTPILAKRFQKRTMALWCLATIAVLTPLTYVGRYYGIMPENGSPYLVPLLWGYSVVVVAVGIMWGILLTSMLTDVVEENEVRSGKRSEGVFFAANTFVAKCVSGLGIFTSAAILALAGFPERATPGQVEPEILWRLVATYVCAIVLLYLLAAACVIAYRITRSSHQRNLETLAAKAAETATVPPTA